MRSLTEVYDNISSRDAELEKQAAELIKQAEEEDAAGRIMARGFADELHKLAESSPFALSSPSQQGAGSAFAGRGQAQRPARAPKVAPASDSNAPGQALSSRSKMNPVTGQHQNPGQPKPPAAAKPKVSMGGGAPRPPGT